MLSGLVASVTLCNSADRVAVENLYVQAERAAFGLEMTIKESKRCLAPSMYPVVTKPPQPEQQDTQLRDSSLGNNYKKGVHACPKCLHQHASQDPCVRPTHLQLHFDDDEDEIVYKPLPSLAAPHPTSFKQLGLPSLYWGNKDRTELGPTSRIVLRVSKTNAVQEMLASYFSYATYRWPSMEKDFGSLYPLSKYVRVIKSYSKMLPCSLSLRDTGICLDAYSYFSKIPFTDLGEMFRSSHLVANPHEFSVALRSFGSYIKLLAKCLRNKEDCILFPGDAVATSY
jgi:hypothetical protein